MNFSFIQGPEFWKGIALAAIVFLTFMPCYRFLVKKMKARSDKIDSHINEAEALRGEAETLLKQVQEKLFFAHKEEQDIIERAHVSSRRLKDQAKKRRMSRLSVRKQEIDDRVRLIEESNLKELRKYVISYAVDSVGKLVGKNKYFSKKEVFFNEALKEFDTVLTTEKEKVIL